MDLEIRTIGLDHLSDFIFPLSTGFGFPMQPERLERLRSIPELDVRLGAYDGAQVVGTAGSYTFELTTPGGAFVETAGLTAVGVIATHRRRGVLSRLMRRYLDGVHERGQAVSALFASEAPIYGRFGYGLGSLCADLEVPRDRRDFVPWLPALPKVRARFVDETEALAAFPPIWDRVRPTIPGMLSRSAGWWRTRRISDPDWNRGGRAPLLRVLLELDGRPAAYALYRMSTTFAGSGLVGALDVAEALGDSPEATQAIWRYLFDVDLVQTLRAPLLAVDHPVFFLSTDPRYLKASIADALWVRLVDVAAALSKRRYGEAGPLVIEVADAFCPWNAGRYRLAGGVAERSTEAADVSLDVTALGSLWLGGFGFTQLAAAGRVVEHTPGALRRGDALFRGERAPWCPEIF